MLLLLPLPKASTIVWLMGVCTQPVIANKPTNTAINLIKNQFTFDPNFPKKNSKGKPPS
jgi:hypothetical protein